jgi:nucleoside-diphosphate-sugar epimerase
MKISIIGGFGYISTSLCELYRDSKDEIFIIDNYFNPTKFKKYTNWGFKVYERDIFNTADLIWDSDILYNLASITAVPTVASQANEKIDSEIHKVGTEGNRYIMRSISDSCKLIFPSTHVVFESLTEEILGITEDFQPCPSLAYSSSKRQSEVDLINSNKSFLICRLGSVYGYNSSIRWKILPNLFSKMAAQNQNLKVFGGNNLKSLIGIKDVSAALKFLAESNYNKEIFNLTSESARVIEIAQIARKYNSSIKIEEVQDEVPNNGYTLSNKKILSTGFEFSQNLDEEIGRMIELWSNK